MKVKPFSIAIISGCFFMFINILAGVPGKWTGTLKTPDDVQYPLAYNLKADGDKLTGTGLSPQGEFEITNGKITGNDFSFNLEVDGKAAKHTGRYIAAGDSLSLDIYFDGNHFHSTLLRAK